jgi:hypothetical protein
MKPILFGAEMMAVGCPSACQVRSAACSVGRSLQVHGELDRRRKRGGTVMFPGWFMQILVYKRILWSNRQFEEWGLYYSDAAGLDV